MTKIERKRIDDMEERIEALENKMKGIIYLFYGIAIGLIIGGILFGVFSVGDLLNTVK